MSGNKIIPTREGKPKNCIRCHKPLHRKSEYYCSTNCYGLHKKESNKPVPAFLSKWKIRKKKEIIDPNYLLRKKTRQISKKLLKEGKIKKKPCIVCGNKNIIIHHEDYENPFKVLFLCEEHHGEIGLFNNKLWWNPNRLIVKNPTSKIQNNKYNAIKKNFKRTKNSKSK